jgi:hypothetical protein
MSVTTGSVTQALKRPDPGSEEISNVVAYIGNVVDIYPLTSQLLVSTDGGKSNSRAIWVSSIFSSLTGLSVKTFPQIGQKVLVLRNTSLNNGLDWCIGTWSDSDSTAEWMITDNYIGLDENAAFSGTDQSNRDNISGTIFNSGHYPKDIVDGEGSIGIAHGASIDFLQNLVRLKASDLAKIEAYVLDDFIRIISQNYEHLSAFGDFKILNNKGSLDVIWRGTSNEHETFDKAQEGESKGIEVKRNGITLEDPTKEDALYADGRWRFQQYVGKLGNFIHMFITEPQKMVDKADSKLTSARSKIYNGVDGSFLVQSVSDIAFEKVIRIPIPVLTCPPEELDMAKMQMDAFQQWNPEDENALYETSYKFLDYGRWLANYYSLAAFHGLKDSGVTVGSEASHSAPTFNVADDKLKQPFSPIQGVFPDYITKYATMRIFKDGSILILNGYGCAVHMAGKDMSLSSPRDINISAAGAVNITGNDINLTARNCVDIVAALRGITMKAQTWFEAACEKGSILLESCMPKEKEDASDSKDQFSSDKIDNAYSQKGLNGGIILKSRFTNIVLSANLGGIVNICRYWFNNAMTVVFKPINFLIDKLLHIKGAVMTIGSAKVHAKSVYTDFLSNKTAGTVTITQQDGLTQKHKESKIDDDELKIKKLGDSIDNSLKSAKTLLDNELNIDQKDIPSFEFRDSLLDSLTPSYDKTYQTVTSQLIGNCYNNKANFFKAESWDSIFSKAPFTGRPFYPVTDNIKAYNPSASSVAPCKQTKFSNKSMTTASVEYFHEPDKYTDDPFYTNES